MQTFNQDILGFLLNLFVNAIASLPFFLLYRLSDFLYFMVFYVFRYRREVVEINLRNSFPEKTEAEIKAISKQFFKDLADLALETIKSLRISPEQLKNRIYIADSEDARKYFAEKKSTLMLTAHFGNWEWAGQIFGLMTTGRPVQVVYMKVKSPTFNELMKKIRTRLGNSVVMMEFSFKEVLKRKDEGIVTCFLADQTPQRHQAGLWNMFLNQPAPFYTGPEKIAQKLNLDVYFGKITKEKRGYYRIDLELITDHAAQEPELYITRQYVRMLEQAIREQPSTWLWSHRRWKHKPEPGDMP